VVEEGGGAEIERGGFFGGADFLFFLDFCEVEALLGGGLFWDMRDLLGMVAVVSCED